MVDIIFVLVMAVFIFCGIKRGFVRSIMNLGSTVISIFLGTLFMKPTAEFLKAGSLGTSIEAIAFNRIETWKSNQVQLPEFMLKGISESASAVFADMIINALSFIIVILLAKIVTVLFINIFSIIFKLPVLKQANALLGGIMGGICGAVMCYVFVGITAVLAPVQETGELTLMLENSVLLSGWFNDNILIKSFMNF